ncbi:hypothetical protein HDU76_012717 [Blyttiomyces sp. JEL0837]|nr:hypothetical protein HDU76_012717 [Blyttiomyces sp. JEL0837]
MTGSTAPSTFNNTNITGNDTNTVVLRPLTERRFSVDSASVYQYRREPSPHQQVTRDGYSRGSGISHDSSQRGIANQNESPNGSQVGLDGGRAQMNGPQWRRSMSTSVVIQRRKGWGVEGDVEDPTDAPSERLVGFKFKLRYPVPPAVKKAHDFSGHVVVSREEIEGSETAERKWKRRWMVVKNNKLYLLKKPSDHAATAIFKLDDCVVKASNYMNHPNSFRVLPPLASVVEKGKEVMLIVITPDDNSKLAWIAAIISAAGYTERQLAQAGRVPVITLQSADDEFDFATDSVTNSTAFNQLQQQQLQQQQQSNSQISTVITNESTSIQYNPIFTTSTSPQSQIDPFPSTASLLSNRTTESASAQTSSTSLALPSARGPDSSRPSTTNSTCSGQSVGSSHSETIVLYPFQPPSVAELGATRSSKVVSAHNDRFFQKPRGRRRSTGSVPVPSQGGVSTYQKGVVTSNGGTSIVNSNGNGNIDGTRSAPGGSAEDEISSEMTRPFAITNEHPSQTGSLDGETEKRLRKQGPHSSAGGGTYVNNSSTNNNSSNNNSSGGGGAPNDFTLTPEQDKVALWRAQSWAPSSQRRRNRSRADTAPPDLDNGSNNDSGGSLTPPRSSGSVRSSNNSNNKIPTTSSTRASGASIISTASSTITESPTESSDMCTSPTQMTNSNELIQDTNTNPVLLPRRQTLPNRLRPRAQSWGNTRPPRMMPLSPEDDGGSIHQMLPPGVENGYNRSNLPSSTPSNTNTNMSSHIQQSAITAVGTSATSSSGSTTTTNIQVLQRHNRRYSLDNSRHPDIGEVDYESDGEELIQGKRDQQQMIIISQGQGQQQQQQHQIIHDSQSHQVSGTSRTGIVGLYGIRTPDGIIPSSIRNRQPNAPGIMIKPTGPTSWRGGVGPHGNELVISGSGGGPLISAAETALSMSARLGLSHSGTGVGVAIGTPGPIVAIGGPQVGVWTTETNITPPIPFPTENSNNNNNNGNLQGHPWGDGKLRYNTNGSSRSSIGSVGSVTSVRSSNTSMLSSAELAQMCGNFFDPVQMDGSGLGESAASSSSVKKR